MVSIDAVTITIGSVQYPLSPIYDQRAWNLLNALQIQPTAIPQFYFARRDDFGIWPIPQSADYTITFNDFIRDRNLSIEDYTTGTVTVTAGSTTLTGASTTFTPAMVGRWFTCNDPTVAGQGYWYRVATYSSSTVLVLEEAWQGSTASGATYRIGQTPELPEESHILLADGATAAFYAGLRNDNPSATWFDNKFWTGSGVNSSRDITDSKVNSGLIGLVNRYASRSKKRLIMKQPQPYLPQYKTWSSTIS